MYKNAAQDILAQGLNLMSTYHINCDNFDKGLETYLKVMHLGCDEFINFDAILY